MTDTEAVKEEIQKDESTERDGEEEEGPPPGWESAVLPSPQPPSPPATAAAAANAASPEMAQMVCGSCRRLLSYPRGSKHVQCSCCQTVNLVLEAHQVGQVKCDGCTVLLMFPYGASSVRCSSCNAVTEIREHNKRPPWSVQQGQPKALATVR